MRWLPPRCTIAAPAISAASIQLKMTPLPFAKFILLTSSIPMMPVAPAL